MSYISGEIPILICFSFMVVLHSSLAESFHSSFFIDSSSHSSSVSHLSGFNWIEELCNVISYLNYNNSCYLMMIFLSLFSIYFVSFLLFLLFCKFSIFLYPTELLYKHLQLFFLITYHLFHLASISVLPFFFLTTFFTVSFNLFVSFSFLFPLMLLCTPSATSFMASLKFSALLNGSLLVSSTFNSLSSSLLVSFLLPNLYFTFLFDLNWCILPYLNLVVTINYNNDL